MASSGGRKRKPRSRADIDDEVREAQRRAKKRAESEGPPIKLVPRPVAYPSPLRRFMRRWFARRYD